MKIGVYGGSFNPVHFGHIGLAKWVVEHTDLDEVWLMVSPNNPLKNTDELAPEQERLAGVRNAIKGIPGLYASDFEFALPRPSYTANTLRELQKKYPQHQFTLIIGEDNWTIFNQWREYAYILDHFPIIIYPRHPLNSITTGSETEQKPSRNRAETDLNRWQTEGKQVVSYLNDAPYFDVSSTELRRCSRRRLASPGLKS